jgi:hypothetical protein
VHPLEHFLFAPRGEWGVVTSHGQHAVVGGTQGFIGDVRARLRYDEAATVRAFVADWTEMAEAGATVDWVPVLLDHVLGAGHGRRVGERAR